MNLNRKGAAWIAVACAASTCSLAPSLALAQQDDPAFESQQAEPTQSTWSARVVREADLEGLPTLLPVGAGASKAASGQSLTLDVSEEALLARPEALRALRAWVRAGNTVFLHTGAARAFGFETVPAREATARMAGQMFGRARTALPLASHPF